MQLAARDHPALPAHGAVYFGERRPQKQEGEEAENSPKEDTGNHRRFETLDDLLDTLQFFSFPITWLDRTVDLVIRGG